MPTLAPIITGIAFLIGSAFYNNFTNKYSYLLKVFDYVNIPFVFEPTKATTIDVEVDEDWTTTVTRIPITNPKPKHFVSIIILMLILKNSIYQR